MKRLSRVKCLMAAAAAALCLTFAAVPAETVFAAPEAEAAVAAEEPAAAETADSSDEDGAVSSSVFIATEIEDED